MHRTIGIGSRTRYARQDSASANHWKKPWTWCNFLIVMLFRFFFVVVGSGDNQPNETISGHHILDLWIRNLIIIKMNGYNNWTEDRLIFPNWNSRHISWFQSDSSSIFMKKQLFIVIFFLSDSTKSNVWYKLVLFFNAAAALWRGRTWTNSFRTQFT